MREIKLEESPPLTRPFELDELFAKPLLVLFSVAVFRFYIPSPFSLFVFSPCRKYCPVDVQHIVKFLG